MMAATRALLAIGGGDEDVTTLTVHACLVTAAALRAAGSYVQARKLAAQALARATDPSWQAAAHNELGDMHAPNCHKTSFEAGLISLAHETAREHATA